MWNTFKYTIISTLREKSVLLWALLFPVVLATLFNVMFSGIDESYSFKAIPTAVIDNTQYQDAEAFEAMIETLSEQSSDQVLDTHFVADAEEAEELLKSGAVDAYISVDASGEPELFLSSTQTLQSLTSVNETILKDILDRYLHTQASIEIIVENNPMVLADPAFVDSLFDLDSYTEEISVTANESSESVRYFYALLGFSTIMAANIALVVVVRTQANLSDLGARRAVGATSRTKTLTATLGAAWLLSFTCLVIAFCFIRFIVGIDFGGRDAECILGLFAASLMATALGAAIGSIPKLPERAKGGIMTGLSCGLALFAGLYGTSSQRLADDITLSAPWFQTANPVKQVADLFYSLYYYDTLDPFFSTVGTILVITAVLALFAAIFMRRQRYASL
ncbi:MAG: ABC transporter permease [Raoultibacter sp.]